MTLTGITVVIHRFHPPLQKTDVNINHYLRLVMYKCSKFLPVHSLNLCVWWILRMIGWQTTHKITNNSHCLFMCVFQRHNTHQCKYLPFTLLPFRCPVPMWAIGAIVVVVLALVGCLGFCIYKKCFNKTKKPKKVRERKTGRGRRKQENEGEEGEEKKVRKGEVQRFCFIPDRTVPENVTGLADGRRWNKFI